MPKLPQFQSTDRDFQLMQSGWAAVIDPVVNNPCNRPLLLKQVSLTTGNNVVNTLLGRNLQGWKIVRQRAAASIYDAQDSNPTPNLTLVLVSDADVTVDIEVF